MNILFISDLYPSDEQPQYCVFLEQQALALQSQGHTVDILLPQKHTVHAPIRKIGTRKGLTLYAYPYRSNKWADLLMLPAKKSEWKRFLNQHHYDAVSMHFGSLRQFRAVASLCKQSNTAVFMHYHGLNVWKDYFVTTKQKLLLPYHTLCKKRFLRQVDAVIGVSDLTCSAVKEHHTTDNVHTVYNGVDQAVFVGSEQRDDSLPFRILCVGNLIPIKGQSYLLQAAAQVIPRHPVEVWLIGNGPDRQKLENEAIQLGIAEHVTFLGTQPYDKVAAYMAQADMFVMPSFFEAFGCVYVEAMSCGTLTCGCNNSGAAEIITDGVDGLLVEEKSAKDIADRILWTIENPEQAAVMAQKGKKKAEQFSWDASAKALVDVYKQYVKASTAV